MIRTLISSWVTSGLLVAVLLVAVRPSNSAGRDPGQKPVGLVEATQLLRQRCVRCHGPARQEGRLSLATPAGLVRGGTSGPVLVREGARLNSLLWKRVLSGSMPPDEKLSAADRRTLRDWISAGSPGLPRQVSAKADGEEHWAFQPLPARLPTPPPAISALASIDRFVESRLRSTGLSLGPEADRTTLIRRVAFDLTGLPPTPAEMQRYLEDQSPAAYEAMVDRYLASPHYGERWGKHWLDAAGYADSNGYFSADTDRPLAFQYRDYVVRSVQADKPWDQFVREQLAGDELIGYRTGQAIQKGDVDALIATHFLRNSQDGTDSSDGNPDEQRVDRYTVLEGTAQILGSTLFGTTIQCARCHDHKFEPVSQKDYYQLQAILYPAFNVEKWVPPVQRVVSTASKEELARWNATRRTLDERIAAERREFAAWLRAHPEPSRRLFEDRFDGEDYRVARLWSNQVPGDASPAGSPPVLIDHPGSPAAIAANGSLKIRESGSPGDRAVSTRQVFDWTPDSEGDWVQVSFDLVAEGAAAPYVGFFLALRDFNDQTNRRGGNILLDGAQTGQAAVHVDYPGSDSSGRGKVGSSGYHPGHRYGIRVTRLSGDRYRLSQWVDGIEEPNTVDLKQEDLPDGGFGFEYCCSRSFVVDNVTIEAAERSAVPAEELQRLTRDRAARKKQLDQAVQALEAQKQPEPGRVALTYDLAGTPPVVRLLTRGEHKLPGEPVEPGPPSMLRERSNPWNVAPALDGSSTGRRKALAEWVTRPGSRAAALLARVTVNRWWQHHFGSGLVQTVDNLGYGGALPSHPELLEYLAGKLVRGGWRAREWHREVLLSRTYRQSSRISEKAARHDPDNRLLSRFPLRRLDAESIRDAMLAASGELDRSQGGKYVPTQRDGEGDVVVAPGTPGELRRSLYLQQRRTQVAGILEVFDAPSIVVNCTFRNLTTQPLQSLKLLNSNFVVRRAEALAGRVRREALDAVQRLHLAYLLTLGRLPVPAESRAALEFLRRQPGHYPGLGAEKADERAWVDFAHTLLAGSAFLYVE